MGRSAVVLGVLLLGCAADPDPTTASGTGGGGPGGSTSGGSGGIGAGGNGGSGGPGGSGGGVCAELQLSPTPIDTPVDIVYVVDNTMGGDQAQQVEALVGSSLFDMVAAGGVDPRLIVVSAHGLSTLPLCIEQPLSSLAPGDCDGPPGDVPGAFYQLDVSVGSWDGLCVLLDTHSGTDGGGYADEWERHPGGWISLLREDARKVFVVTFDDGTRCTPDHPLFPSAPELADRFSSQATVVQDGLDAAVAFESMLTQLAPHQFGTVSDRRWVWHSIVGIPPKAQPADPYAPHEAIVDAAGDCPNGNGDLVRGWAPNTANQWLSTRSGGLRFPSCATGEYDAVFETIAADITKPTPIPCDIALPEPPAGQVAELSTLEAVIAPGGGGMIELTRVTSAAHCEVSDTTFWLDESAAPSVLHLCALTCERLQSDPGAELDLRYGCAP